MSAWVCEACFWDHWKPWRADASVARLTGPLVLLVLLAIALFAVVLVVGAGR